MVILHEESENGRAMSDLTKPVEAVSMAVENLKKVGKDTINQSEDEILRNEMPNSLLRVEQAARLLEEANQIFRQDAYSQPARKLLLEGSRGILQGTSSLLLCFDESEVRKIIKACKRVLDYINCVDVIERIEDLLQFAKDLTPALGKMTRLVDARQKELTHQAHRDILIKCLDQLKQLAPVLISSMKIYVQLLQDNKSINEARENRNYISQRTADEVHEIIRVLQLTTYDEQEWDADPLTYMKRALGAMTSKYQSAHDWLEDPYSPNGGLGEKSLRQILEHAERIADRAQPDDREAIRKCCGDIRSMVNSLCELRQTGQNTCPQAQSLAKNIGQQLKDLLQLCQRAIANMDKHGAENKQSQVSHTLTGRIDQAQRWLNNLTNPGFDDQGLGEQAIQAIVDEARQLALYLSPAAYCKQLLELCNDVERMNKQLGDLNRLRRQQPNNVDQQQMLSLARELSKKLYELQRFIHAALVSRVVDDFIDATLALRQFSEAVLAPETDLNREQNLLDKARQLSDWSKRSAQTGRHVATNCAHNKRHAEAILASANRLESMTPQLINSGRIKFTNVKNTNANENFIQMRDQYESEIQRLRQLIDEAIDSSAFVTASEQAIRKHTQLCEQSIANQNVQSMIDNASIIARLSNRVLMIARQEASNSEDNYYTTRIEECTRKLQDIVPTMVRNAKDVAINITDQRNQNAWRQSNQEIIDTITQLSKVIGPSQLPDLSRLNISTRE